MDITVQQKDCDALAGLFQHIVTDLRVCSPSFLVFDVHFYVVFWPITSVVQVYWSTSHPNPNPGWWTSFGPECRAVVRVFCLCVPRQ